MDSLILASYSSGLLPVVALLFCCGATIFLSLFKNFLNVVASGKSPGVVGFRELGVGVPGLLAGVSLPGLGWAIA